MSMNFTFRKIKGTEALKEHVEKRLEKFEKYVNYPMDIHVLLSVEKTYQVAEITCHAEHRQMVAMTKCKDLYEAIDMAAHKIESQLKKEREKRKGHKTAHVVARKRSLKLARDVDAEIPHKEKIVSE